MNPDFNLMLAFSPEWLLLANIHSQDNLVNRWFGRIGWDGLLYVAIE